MDDHDRAKPYSCAISGRIDVSFFAILSVFLYFDVILELSTSMLKYQLQNCKFEKKILSCSPDP